MQARSCSTIRSEARARPNGPARLVLLAAALAAATGLCAQAPAPDERALPNQTEQPAQAPAAQAPAEQAPATQGPANPPDPSSAPDPGGADVAARPIAIVPLDAKIPGAAAEVTGGLQVFNGRAFIASSGAITSGAQTTNVVLPYRGTLRVCAGSTVRLASDTNVPGGEVPGLLMGLQSGALEASFATGRDSDILLTPDFRIIIGGPGAAEVRVRLGPGGDTCVDNAGVNAPYVLVSSAFEGGAYRVQSGQRVMFQHGSLHEVVDAEKEPCGCPPAGTGGNEFPLAESEGLAPTLHPVPVPANQVGNEAEGSGALIYNGAEHARKAAEPAPAETAPLPTAPAAPPAAAPAAPPATPPPPAKKPGVFRRIGRFFKRVFGAD